MTDICNYKIILIDTSNVIYNGNSNIYDFHIKLTDNIKDVYKIKILFDAVSIPTSKLLDPAHTINLDNIYINLNDYDRVKSNTITLGIFDSIMIDFNKIKAIPNITDITMFNDFNENE